MDWQALEVSLRLGALTVLILAPIAIAVARWLAFRRFAARPLIEAMLALPLVLPPTVLGYYLLVALGGNSPIGGGWRALFGHSLVFSFEALLIGSLIVNLPFAIQPMQRSFQAIPADIREAAMVSGFAPWRLLWRIDLPLAWPGIVTGLVLTFAHTLGEFGVVLMLGGSIPGQTRTIAVAIYDRVQAFDMGGAGAMAALLLGLSLAALAIVYSLSNRVARRD